jgi:hypothetical protein
VRPLFWELGGRQKAEFVARPLPGDEAMRDGLAAEASAGELRLRLVGVALAVVSFTALFCWARHVRPLPWPAAIAGLVIASLYAALKLGQRRRRDRLARATDLGTEFRMYRRRLADQLEIAIMLGATALAGAILTAVAQNIDAHGVRVTLTLAFAAFLVGDLLVIERLRRLMRRSRPRA